MAPRPNAQTPSPTRLVPDGGGDDSASAPPKSRVVVGVDDSSLTLPLSLPPSSSTSKTSCSCCCPPHVASHLLSRHGIVVTSATEIRSAQQFVCVVSVQIRGGGGGGDCEGTTRERERFLSALESGNGRLVVREWRASARWWNLNSNGGSCCGGLLSSDGGGSGGDGGDAAASSRKAAAAAAEAAIDMARREVAGYRVAGEALRCAQGPDDGPGDVEMPEVLHFSHDDDVGRGPSTDGGGIAQPPWAVFSYVGEHSARFVPPTAAGCNGNSRGDSVVRRAAPQSSGPAAETTPPPTGGCVWVYDGRFSPSMVKVRREFGFDEPHPRHGRVEECRALEYGMEVLDRVVLPLQGAFFDGRLGAAANDCAEGAATAGGSITITTRELLRLGRPRSERESEVGTVLRPYRYWDMVDIYDAAVSRMDKVLRRARGDSNNDTDEEECNNDGDGAGDMSVLVSVLSKCVAALREEASPVEGRGLPPATLCHMDLQPQNMILRRPPLTNEGKKEHPAAVPFVASVLDWEEACLADPRFEVLLMCRKVLANREQADALWESYSVSVLDRHGIDMGPIEPWLRLEGVHSVTTMALQGMDMAGGGRSPWEGRPDLWGKIERELLRLRWLGWEFCGRALGEHNPFKLTNV